MATAAADRVPLCPSAQPTWDGSVAFGVVGGTATEPRVGYLTGTLPVTEELLAATAPVKPTEVVRFAAPCAGTACAHFDGEDCRLVTKIVQLLPAVIERLPRCHIRSRCRWWLQEGGAACRRCPGVVTESYNAPESLRRAADPAVA